MFPQHLDNRAIAWLLFRKLHFALLTTLRHKKTQNYKEERKKYRQFHFRIYVHIGRLHSPKAPVKLTALHSWSGIIISPYFVSWIDESVLTHTHTESLFGNWNTSDRGCITTCIKKGTRTQIISSKRQITLKQFSVPFKGFQVVWLKDEFDNFSNNIFSTFSVWGTGLLLETPEVSSIICYQNRKVRKLMSTGKTASNVVRSNKRECSREKATILLAERFHFLQRKWINSSAIAKNIHELLVSGPNYAVSFELTIIHLINS